MKDPKFIHFFGPDGAGKTTQVDIILEYLASRGVKAKKCWVRSPHTLAYLLWKLFVKIGFYRTMWNPFGIGIRIPAVNRSLVLRRFWGLIEFLSVLPHIIRINFLLSRGHVIVAERYILDTIATIAFFVDDIGFLSSFLGGLLVRLLPRNVSLIFVDADFKSILNRRRPLFYERQREMQNPSTKKRIRVYGYVPNSVVEPQEFIDFQREAYKILAERLGAFEIFSPDYTIEETTNIILGFLGYNQ